MGKRRAFALILAIFFLALMQLLALGFGRMVPAELNAGLRYKLDTEGYLAADAGLQYAVAYIEQRLSALTEPVVDDGSDKLVLRSRDALDSVPLGEGWTWEAEVVPDEQTFPIGNNPRRAYHIRSTASLDGRKYRVVEADVIQQSFVEYARLTDHWPDTVASYAGAQTFDGPVHTNDVIRVGIHPGFYTNGDPRLFNPDPNDRFRITSARRDASSPDGVTYIGPEPPPWAAGIPDEQAYGRLYGYKASGEARRPVTGVERIEIPTGQDSLRYMAWGDNSPEPTSEGVHVRAAGGDVVGGVFIVGDVQSMELQVQGGQPKQVIRMAGGGTWQVIENRSAGTTTVVQPGGAVDTLPGLPNGAIFCTGNILGLKGVNKGRHTIGVDTENGKDIILRGDVLQHGVTPGTRPTSNDNALGLVAYNLRIPFDHPRTNPIYVYAAILAGRGDETGGMQTDNLAGIGAGDHNYFYIYGSVSEDRRNIMADVGLVAGWTTRIFYDKHLKNEPPPGFPATPRMQLKSYLDAHLAD